MRPSCKQASCKIKVIHQWSNRLIVKKIIFFGSVISETQGETLQDLENHIINIIIFVLKYYKYVYQKTSLANHFTYFKIN